jgi:chromosome segregation ATPase
VLCRWSEEVAAAQNELESTQRSLTEIDSNIASLQRAVEADKQRYDSSLQARHLQREVSSTAEELAQVLQHQCHHLQAQASCAKADQELLQVSLLS